MIGTLLQPGAGGQREQSATALDAQKPVSRT